MKISSDTRENIKLVEEAFAALQAGNCKKARDSFERIVTLGQADATSWLGLAHACSKLGDNTAVFAAVDKSLELEPGNLRALIFKADKLEQSGESRVALEYYQHVLALGNNLEELPKDVMDGLQRAQQACDRKDAEYKSFLSEKMKEEGFSPSPTNRRFQQSLGLIFESKKIFYQEPRRYYYPGLPQIQFYEREQFEWVEALEAATDAIRGELGMVMNSPSKFSPYLQADSNHLNQFDDSLLNKNDWSALYLWEHGHLVPENTVLFPQTVNVLESAPMPFISAQAPMALFSKLTPGTRIPPHNGLLNTRLICHLPIIVPENGGALRVGNEERAWVEGEMLIFDDSIQHEAWNTAHEERVVLLFEIWRPEINEEERLLITGLLAAVKEYYKK
ncbi:MAG: aspartate beta-hydroxylase [Gammaproteobacteria bacterium]|jgi:aspartate beta-hydroxylase